MVTYYVYVSKALVFRKCPSRYLKIKGIVFNLYSNDSEKKLCAYMRGRMKHNSKMLALGKSGYMF